MKRVLSLFACIAMCAALCACHAVQPENTDHNNPGTAGSQVTEPPTIDTMPATAPTAVPTEPTMPAEVISEIRKDGLLYIPDVVHYIYSSRLLVLNFGIEETLYPDMEITFDISTNWGALYYFPEGEYYKNFSHKNQFYVQWRYELYHPEYLGKMELINEVGGAVFVDAVIRADGHVVGYGLFEIGTADAYEFALMRAETVIFPMVDGQLQYVTEEYVADRIAELKQTVTPFDLEVKRAECDAYLKEYWEQQKATEPTQP